MTPSSSASLPRQDNGFFGPDSITWRVFTYPTAPVVGFQRTVVVEMFEPFLMAAVHDTQAVMRRPNARYDRTLQYTATIAFADSATAVKAADVLMRIHQHIVGTEPMSGGTYDANDPEAQLWIHLTQWHSVLYAYEVFGPGPLSAQEEEQYWRECAVAAELQTIDPAGVPRSREEMRAYFARMRPVLAGTEAAQVTAGHLLASANTLFDDAPLGLRMLRRPISAVLRRATIATLPTWLRRMAGVRQGRITDAAVILVLRPVMRALARRPELQVRMLSTIAPHACPVMAPVLLGLPPERDEVVAPAQAWERAGRPTPREQYAVQLAERGTVAAHAPRDQGVAALVPFG